MTYTVNKLAKLAGISIRTLHFYDEIGLLKPAYYGVNNYRYYEEAELLTLQQILFFRELGFQLSDIQKIISTPDFDKVTTLESHRKILEKNIEQTKHLLATIDKTIAHLKGKNTMKLDEIFEGFSKEKQKHYEDYLVDHGVSQSVIHESKHRVKDWKKEDWLKVKADADQLHRDLIVAINLGLSPTSAETQSLIKKHYQFTKLFWTPNRESYIGLSQLYSSHPDFEKFYADQHPKLLSYLVEGMKFFAIAELT